MIRYNEKILIDKLNFHFKNTSKVHFNNLKQIEIKNNLDIASRFIY
jgi:hypothetical protein